MSKINLNGDVVFALKLQKDLAKKLKIFVIESDIYKNATEFIAHLITKELNKTHRG